MSKVYGFIMRVEHYVEVVADSQEEAEEYALDKFSDDAGLWDDFDMGLDYKEEL